MRRFELIVGAVAAVAVVVSSCAPSRGSRGAREFNPSSASSSLNIADRLLNDARDLAAKGDCRTALPSFRVLAGYGDGYEVAQIGLAECALAVAQEAAGPERELLLMEVRFWYERAAYADNPQAQRQLSALYAPGGDLEPDSVRSLAWALIYNANGARDTLSLPPVHAVEIEKIQNDLNTEQYAKARILVDEYRPVTMAAFSPPNTPYARGPGAGRGPGGDRRRRRPQ